MQELLEQRAIEPFQLLRRAVLIVDVAESVRLMENDERGTIMRWLDVSRHLEQRIFPRFAGRVVKSLGDGLLVEFETPRAAVAAAIETQKEAQALGAGQEGGIRLRIGVEVSDVVVAPSDIYGQGVNIAARLAGLAQPGDIVVSANVREYLTQDVDSDIEDMGLCYVKNLSRPLRAYRIRHADAGAAPLPGSGTTAIVPTIGVIPFACGSSDPADRIIGEILADEIIETLSPSMTANVLSRLTTTSLRDRDQSLATAKLRLGAHYLLTGSYLVSGQRIRLHVEFLETETGRAIWAEGFRLGVSEIVDGEQQVVNRILEKISTAMANQLMVRFRRERLPTIESHALLIGAIALLNRFAPSDMELAEEILVETRSRAPYHPAPSAWLAYLSVMRVQQGLAQDRRDEGQVALDHARRALDLDPGCALALTMEGLVNTHFRRRPDIALRLFEQAVGCNPNLGIAWLLMGTTEALSGDGAAAVRYTSRAMALSPLDPHRDYYQSLAATACLAAHKDEEALSLADQSIKANRLHSSTHRVRVAALWRLGRHDDARDAAAQLLAVEPNLTVSGWLRRSPTAEFPLGKEFAEVMRQVGVPA